MFWWIGQLFCYLSTTLITCSLQVRITFALKIPSISWVFWSFQCISVFSLNHSTSLLRKGMKQRSIKMIMLMYVEVYGRPGALWAGYSDGRGSIALLSPTLPYIFFCITTITRCPILSFSYSISCDKLNGRMSIYPNFLCYLGFALEIGRVL